MKYINRIRLGIWTSIENLNSPKLIFESRFLRRFRSDLTRPLLLKGRVRSDLIRLKNRLRLPTYRRGPSPIFPSRSFSSDSVGDSTGVPGGMRAHSPSEPEPPHVALTRGAQREREREGKKDARVGGAAGKMVRQKGKFSSWQSPKPVPETWD